MSKKLSWGEIVQKKQRLHARKRLKERYGVEHTPILKELNRMLKFKRNSPDFQIIRAEKQSCSRTFYHVIYKDNQYKFIYSSSTKQIITFYYLNDEDYYETL